MNIDIDDWHKCPVCGKKTVAVGETIDSMLGYEAVYVYWCTKCRANYHSPNNYLKSHVENPDNFITQPFVFR